MTSYRRLARLRPGRRRELLDELEEEIRAHVEMRAESLMSEGLTAEEARAEALRRFGDLAAGRRALLLEVRRGERSRRWSGLLEALARDAWLALRSARRAPGSSAFSVVILAMAVGLAAATFTAVDHVLLRPPPYPEPSRLVALQSVGEAGAFPQVSMSNWVDWRERGSTLSATALWRTSRVTVAAGEAEPFRVDGVLGHGDLWGTLRARFVRGRGPSEGESQAGDRLVVVSEELWRRVLGAAPDLDGLGLTLDGSRYEVVGVLARGQEFPPGAQLWIQTPWEPGSGAMRNNVNYEAVARLRPGVAVEQAAADLSGVARGIRESDPEALYSHGVGVLPLHDRLAGAARRSLGFLMAAVLLVLGVACANLAGLGVARARRREHDLEVRLALGSGRARLVRQALAEQAVLAAAGAGLGLGLAWLGSRAVIGALPWGVAGAAGTLVDGRVVLFGALAAAAAAVVTALGPMAAILRGGRAPGVFGAGGRVRGGRGLPGGAMVATELALATALLVGGGLLVRSFAAAASRPLGYDPEDVTTLDVALASRAYRDTEVGVRYWTELLERLRGEPGVLAAAVGNWIPTGGGGTSFVELEGGAEGDLGAGYRVVSDEYVEAMGMTLLAGRAFTAADDLGTERVGLVNRALADRYWPGEPPLGKRIRATSMEAYFHGGEAPWITVVGVVGDVRHFGFESDPRPELFVLYRQVPDWTRAMTAVVRTRPGAGVPAERLHAVARSLDPSLAVEASALSSRVRALLAERRLVLGVLWTFAGLAALLACVGVYALISFAVEERKRELAVRTTLGADARGILALVMGSAVRVVAGGLAGGLVAGSVLSGLLESLLLDVTATDPLTYAAAALVLGMVGLAAALPPCWRAARADPVAVLRAS